MKKNKKTFSWDDYFLIAEKLYEAEPSVTPVSLSPADVIARARKLSGFEGPETPPTSVYATAIQNTWIKLWHGDTTSGYEDESTL